MLAEVLARYVLDAPLTWTAELAGFVLVWVVMLGITLGVREGSHYGVQLLANRLPARPRVAAEAVRDAATIGFFLVMAWEGFQAMRVNGDISSSVLNIPLSWIYLAFVVSGVIGAVNAINRIAHHATRPARAIATALVIIAVMATLLVVFYVSETLILPVVLVTAVVLLVVGTPIAIVIGMSVMVGIQLTRLASLEIAVEQMFNAIDNFTLIAVPFFMLTGTILLETRLADRLIDFAMILVGRSRGGLAYVDIVASCLFADISGSSTSDTAAIGSTMIPGMAAAGYRREFATGLQAASGSMGMLVPPSTCTIIYATVAGVSVLDMFAASILPALLMACSFALVVFWYARRSGLPKGPRIGIRDAVHKLRRAILPLLTPVIILAGIFSGAITAAEAGAVAVAYSVLAAAGSRSLSRQNGSRALATGTRNFSIVFFVISTAMLLSYVLSYEQIPQSVARITLGLSSKAIIVLLMIMVVMVVIHTVLEAVATILIVTPIFVPPLMEMGVSPIHFGVLLMMNSSIGLILPPIGLCLYISSAIGKVPIERAAKAVIPFASVIACDLVILIVFPQISTVVPHLLGR
ncbi:MAG TPA: TRAP transporter large permease subunit [Arthrobacter sp.]|nr:TRAP transporter large permease subunit [Arthrobacter sp.]